MWARRWEQTNTSINGSAPTGSISYDDAIRRGKEIVASHSAKQWELGDLAAEVAKVYGERYSKSTPTGSQLSSATPTSAKLRRARLGGNGAPRRTQHRQQQRQMKRTTS
jgi:hypothetical protein